MHEGRINHMKHRVSPFYITPEDSRLLVNQRMVFT